jgi:hypothetical protein
MLSHYPASAGSASVNSNGHANGGAQTRARFATASSVPRINGRGIGRRRLSKVQKAAYAAMEALGEIMVTPSRVRASADWGVSLVYVATLEKVSPELRVAIARGAYIPSFSDLAQHCTPNSADAQETPAPQPPISDEDLVALGVERLLMAACAADRQSNRAA